MAPTKTTVFYGNVASSSSVYSCDNEATGFPATNLYGHDIHATSRTTVMGVGSTVTWTMTLGSAQSIDTFAIAGSNLDGQTALTTYTLGVSRDNGSPSYSTINPQTQDTKNGAIIYYWDTASSCTYVRFRITSTVAASTYYEIGVMWAGARVELGQNPQIPIEIIDEREVTQLATRGGQIWTYDNHSRSGYNLKFIEDFTPANYAALKTVHDSCELTFPFFFHLSPADSNDSVMYARTTSFNFRIDGKDARPGTWTIKEEI